MKQRIYSLLFALLAIVTGAKAANPVVLEIYDTQKIDYDELNALNILAGALAADGVFYKVNNNSLTTYYNERGGKILFSIKTGKEPAMTVPTYVTASVKKYTLSKTGLKYLSDNGVPEAQLSNFTNLTVSFQISINATNFTDATFRSYIKDNFDTETNNSGRLTIKECTAVEKIDVYNKNIASLKGVEYFSELTTLNCVNNQLENLDVSKNKKLEDLLCASNLLNELNVAQNTALYTLDCSYNQLTTLDVSKNTSLTYLDCYNNQLTSLDVSSCTTLERLFCYYNQLISLDVSKNTALDYLSCDHNQLVSLDASKNTALTYLYCNNNQLESLDVSSCAVLDYLCCDHNQTTSLDVSKNTALTHLWCNDNQLTSLDVSGCTALTKLSCQDNQLTSLDVSGCTALTELGCYDNQLTSLDLSKNTALKELYCYNNQLTSLDVSKNTALRYLDCCNNQLTSLDLSKNTVLYNLNCRDNQLTSLNVSSYMELSYLYCDYNQLTSLKVSGCTALYDLDCDNNRLTSLDVTGCSALRYLDLYQNQIRGTGMAVLVNSLPGDRSDADMYVYSAYGSPEGNVITRIQAQIAREEKGWKLLKFDEAADNWVEYFGEAVRGDANGDGELTAADVETISDYILGRLPDDQPIDEESADLNEDHEINIEDVTLLIDMIVENDDQPDEQVYKQCPNDHHPHIIDLGLPSGTLWSCCNIGADAPSAYGTYYKWSESVAEDAWGAKWATPTIDQLHELLEKTPSVWTTKDGINGRLFTAENGAKLFLPAGGMNPGYVGDGVGEYIYYRSSTKKEEESYINLGVYSDKNTVVGDWDYPHTITMPVRPVRK